MFLVFWYASLVLLVVIVVCFQLSFLQMCVHIVVSPLWLLLFLSVCVVVVVAFVVAVVVVAVVVVLLVFVVACWTCGCACGCGCCSRCCCCLMLRLLHYGCWLLFVYVIVCVICCVFF